MRFETQKDIQRETKAIECFCKEYDCDYYKLGKWEVDYKITKHNLITYAEVKGRKKDIIDSYPLPLSIRKVYKLMKKCNDPVIIWACNNGILYAKLTNLIGEIKLGGRKPRQGSSNDVEIMAYYQKQDSIKEIKY